MGATEPGSAREEAERLVATLIATARLASAGTGSGAGPWGPLGGIVSGVLGHSAGPSRPAGGSHRADGFSHRIDGVLHLSDLPGYRRVARSEPRVRRTARHRRG